MPVIQKKPPTPIDDARKLRGRGFGIVWLEPSEKRPSAKGWTLKSQDPGDYSPGCNLGLLTGRLSDDLVCVDLDSDEALAAADDYLPPTGMIDGRPSKPRSHRWYRVKDIPPEMTSTAAGGLGGPWLKHFRGAGLDFLGTGGQAVVPPSKHPSGEQRRWDSNGEPAVVSMAKLWDAVCRLARHCGWETPAPPPVNGSANGHHPKDGSVQGRARRYLAKIPGAVSGDCGHDRTFHVACVLTHGFALSAADAYPVLAEWNQTCCDPPWNERELWHKLDDAEAKEGPRAHLLAVTGKPEASVPAEPGAIREIDAMDLMTAEDVQPLETLPVLGLDGYILKGGSNIISAYPKVGKTTAVHKCVADWMELGESIAWFTEESEPVWRDRLTKRQWINQRGLTLVFGYGAGTDRLLPRVHGDETVVVLDTLRGLGILPEEENHPGAVSRSIEPWVLACRQLGKTLIILHHDNKAGGSHGRGITGAHSLLGAVDVALQVQRGKEENQRIITAMGRIGQQPELHYEQLADGTLQVVESTAATLMRAIKAKKDLVAMLPTEPPGWTVDDLVREAKVTKRDALDAMSKAKDDGLVVKNGNGRRGDPFTYHRR